MEQRGQAWVDDTWPEPIRGFQSWGKGLFVLVLIVGLISGPTIVGSSDIRPLARMLAAVGSGLGIAVSLTMISALSSRRVWALEATAWVCWLLIASGVTRAAIDLAAGRVTVPLEPVAALLVLNRRPPRPYRPQLDAPGIRAVALTVGAFVLSAATLVLATPVAGGAILGATSDSIDLVVDVACSDLAGDPDALITIDARWNWRSTEPFPGSTDGLVVSWIGETGASGPGENPFYWSDLNTDPADGVWRGGGSPSAALIQPIEAAGPSVAFGIDVAKVGMRDGAVSVILGPKSPTHPHGWIAVWATYAHLDWWVRQSDPVECRW